LVRSREGAEGEDGKQTSCLWLKKKKEVFEHPKGQEEKRNRVNLNGRET